MNRLWNRLSTPVRIAIGIPILFLIFYRMWRYTRADPEGIYILAVSFAILIATALVFHWLRQKRR